MRFRLFEMGSNTSTAVYIEEFPVGLALTPQGDLDSHPDLNCELCRLEEIDGQIIFHASGKSPELSVNGAPLAEGPLMPGDRLRLLDRQFVISYEPIAAREAYPSRFRIQN